MANITMGTSPSRATFVQKDSTIGPGHYDDRNYEIKNSSKSFIIGEKRAERVKEGMGPGAYSPERADTITKTKMASVNMGTSPSRATFVQKDSAIGPGQYDDRNYEVSKSTKSFIIGEKRAEKRIVDNRDYDHERAE